MTKTLKFLQWCIGMALMLVVWLPMCVSILGFWIGMELTKVREE